MLVLNEKIFICALLMCNNSNILDWDLKVVSLIYLQFFSSGIFFCFVYVGNQGQVISIAYIVTPIATLLNFNETFFFNAGSPSRNTNKASYSMGHLEEAIKLIDEKWRNPKRLRTIFMPQGKRTRQNNQENGHVFYGCTINQIRVVWGYY